MLKLLLNIVQIFIGIYWAGEVARQNPKVDSFVAQLESGYEKFNLGLNDTKIVEGLAALRRIYGWLAVATIIFFFAFSRFFAGSPRLGYLWSLSFIVSLFGWFSIKWCLDHKKTVSEFGPQIALIVFGPLLMGVFDLLMGTPFTQILSGPIQAMPNPWGDQLSLPANPIGFGAVLSLVLAVFFAIYYSVTWLLTAPAAFGSAILIAIPVFLARFVQAVWPRKPFFGFTVLLFAGASLWQLWL